jgi:prolyl-tRNA synthetase
MGANFLDAEGKSKPVIMGSYGIGSGRLMASVVEEHHDENGLMWPISIAPYEVHLIALSSKAMKSDADKDDLDPVEVAEQLYQEFLSAGIEILFDDRHESPGVKFNDADLIGVPIRLTVSERALKSGGIEVKKRVQKEKEIIPIGEIQDYIKSTIDGLKSKLEEMVIRVPFEE